MAARDSLVPELIFANNTADKRFSPKLKKQIPSKRIRRATNVLFWKKYLRKVYEYTVLCPYNISANNVRQKYLKKYKAVSAGKNP